MNEIASEVLKSLLPSVKKDRKYWLVRSMGGDYYGEYVSHGYIAIGFNEVTLDEIKLSASKEAKALKELKSIISSKDLDEKRTKYYNRYGAAQLLKFYNEIKEGDIVIVPGIESYKIAIGIIESRVYEVSDSALPVATDYCQFKKRRNFSLLKEVSRSRLNPEMQLMFNSRHIVSNVDKYSEFIDSSIRDFYQKGDTTYLLLNVRQKDEISALDFNLVPEIINLISDFAKENGLEFDRDAVKMKICVQSPGDILVFADKIPEYILLIGCVIVALQGYDLNIFEKIKFKVPSVFEGIGHLLKEFSDFLDRREDRKVKESLRKKVDNMNIDTPQGVNEILDALNRIREKY